MPARFLSSSKLSVVFAVLALIGTASGGVAAELVYVDDTGAVRWEADQSEVALFGANYGIASASDYRAAGYVGADRKKTIERDLAHFSRMGWGGLRLAWWGDWENCDREGNLIVNDHLDVLDFMIAEAKRRGIHMLLTPVHRHSALWPDDQQNQTTQGFARHFPPGEWDSNPEAIAAQTNYIRQLLEHVNPYTGVAMKNEPSILFIELINEPHHHAENREGSIRYIDTLVEAVRSTGCEKILFFNLSQDFRMSPVIAASKVQGLTLGWYPTGLLAGRTLEENYLRWVDTYEPLLGPGVPGIPRIVYEFDTADVLSGHLYPAMVRAFRGVGVQFAAMFAYDMLDTAPYNLGWQTHFLNLVHSPRKALSTVIAAEAMRVLPRNGEYGGYPQNRSFGPFRVSYEEDLSEMVTNETFLHSNDTATMPPQPAALSRIAGVGSSPLIEYEGCGAYFLDRLDAGVWRLEVYPDAVLVQDPFAQRLNHQAVSSRLIARAWPMTVRLPDLGEIFHVTSLIDSASPGVRAGAGRFECNPGVYLLSRHAPPDRARLPLQVRGVGLAEFVCPEIPDLPPALLPDLRSEYVAGEPMSFSLQVVDEERPDSVTLKARSQGGGDFRSFELAPVRGYAFEVVVPADAFPEGTVEYFYEATIDGARIRHPVTPDGVLVAHVVPASAPLTLFAAGTDRSRLLMTRGNEANRRIRMDYLTAADGRPAVLHLVAPPSSIGAPPDFTVSISLLERMRERAGNVNALEALHIRARASHTGQTMQIGLLESDGTCWGTSIVLDREWRDLAIPFEQLRVVRGVKLPQGYPGNWNYWLTPAASRGGAEDRPRVEALQHLQMSVREALGNGGGATETPAPWVEVSAVDLRINSDTR